MTPFQLRQWLSQNGKEDKWWLSIDAVTDEIPVTVAEIEERMKSGDYSAVQALHVSQAGMTNPTWTDVAVTPSPTKPTTTLDELATDEEAPRRNRGSSDSIPPWGWIVIGGVLIAILVSFFYAARIYVGIPLVLIPFGLVVTNWVSKGTLSGCLLLVGLVLLTPCFVYLFFMNVDYFDRSVVKSRGSSAEPTQSQREAGGAGEHTISGDNFTGFTHLEDDERASELAGDTEAFSKFFLAGVMTKRATLFKRGETVILEDAEGILSNKVKLRRKGEAVSYWTNREAID